MARGRGAAVMLGATVVATILATGCNRRPQAELVYEEPVTTITTGTQPAAPAQPTAPPPSGPSRGGWRHAKDKDQNPNQQ